MPNLPQVNLETVLIAAFIGAVFGLVALLLIGIGWLGQRKAASSRSWPSVPGRVMTAEVETSAGGEGGTVYRTLITYSYMVGGQQYQSNRRAFADTVSSGNRGSAERGAAQYPPGSAVPVYYNPANPQDAVLERRAASAGFMYGLGGAFLVFGCGGAACVAGLYIAGLFAPAGG